MNESDKNRLRNSYHDIRFAALKLFHSIGDGSKVCMSLYEKIRNIHDYIDDASDLFEVSAVSECSDYLRFYVNLRVWCHDLRKHVVYVEREIPVDSVIKKGIENLCAVVLRDEALFGYSDTAKSVSDSIPVSYFTHYDFTLPVSLGRMNNDM